MTSRGLQGKQNAGKRPVHLARGAVSSPFINNLAEIPAVVEEKNGREQELQLTESIEQKESSVFYEGMKGKIGREGEHGGRREQQPVLQRTQWGEKSQRSRVPVNCPLRETAMEETKNYVREQGKIGEKTAQSCTQAGTREEERLLWTGK